MLLALLVLSPSAAAAQGGREGQWVVPPGREAEIMEAAQALSLDGCSPASISVAAGELSATTTCAGTPYTVLVRPVERDLEDASEAGAAHPFDVRARVSPSGAPASAALDARAQAFVRALPEGLFVDASSGLTPAQGAVGARSPADELHVEVWVLAGLTLLGLLVVAFRWRDDFWGRLAASGPRQRVAAFQVMLVLSYIATSQGVLHLFPFSLFDMYSSSGDESAARTVVLDAEGRAQELDSFVDWACDGPVDPSAERPFGNERGTSEAYLEHDFAHHIVNHRGEGGDPVRIVRRVYSFDANGRLLWEDLPVLSCTARRIP